LHTSIELTSVLVKRLKNRDVTALDYLYDHYSGALFGIIQRTLNNKQAAEETLHDVFIKIWNQIEKFDETKGTLFTWMYRIARNQAIDKRRSKEFKVELKSNDIDSYVNQFEASESGVDYLGLSEVIAALGSVCKRLIQLNFFMGYTHAEISENENMPLGSVKTKMRNCLKQLRTQLSQDFE
jgi:RNA polymerase sigma factor (sigma-70 family)